MESVQLGTLFFYVLATLPDSVIFPSAHFSKYLNQFCMKVDINTLIRFINYGFIGCVSILLVTRSLVVNLDLVLSEGCVDAKCYPKCRYCRFKS
jgi:hypothetical protein